MKGRNGDGVQGHTRVMSCLQAAFDTAFSTMAPSFCSATSYPSRAADGMAGMFMESRFETMSMWPVLADLRG